jgi:hypothetical protein
MGDIRILSWNIKDFGADTLGVSGNTTRIMRAIYDAANTRLVDVFVIVEPVLRCKIKNVGAVPTAGQGIIGLQALFYLLWQKENAWRMLPPRATAASAKKDMTAIYYFSDTVLLRGPEELDDIPAANVAGAVVKPIGSPDPWGSDHRTFVGQIRYYNTTVIPKKEVDFGGRRPLLARFAEKAAPVASVTATTRLRIYIAGLPPAALIGPLAITTQTQLPDAATNQPYRQKMVCEGGTGPYTWTVNALAGGLSIAADGSITGTPTVAGALAFQVEVEDSAIPAKTKITKNLNVDVKDSIVVTNENPLADATVGTAYDIVLTSAGGGAAYHWSVSSGALPPGLHLRDDGAILGTPDGTATGVYEFEVTVADHLNEFMLMGLHAPPQADYPANAVAIEKLANIEEITTNRAGVATVIVGDFNCCVSTLADHNETPREKNAQDKITAKNYDTHITTLTSLKDLGCAHDAYRKHAFDHVVTSQTGFTAVKNPQLLDMVHDDPDYAPAVVKATAVVVDTSDWELLFKRWHRPNTGDPIQGVSDHLPVKVTVEF